MPFVEANGVRMHYEWDGVTSGPTIAFSNSLGTTLQMWNRQVAALGSRYRLLRYDTRGHATLQSPAVRIRSNRSLQISLRCWTFSALRDAISVD
jgi:hypothetical protein